MDDYQLQSRLSRIETEWSLVDEAAKGTGSPAQAELIRRYRQPIYRYLVAILRSPDAADEVFQDFSLRLARGDFRGADREKGRFRSFVKTVLSRMAVDYHRRRRTTGTAATISSNDVEQLDDKSAELDFKQNWTSELIRLAMSRLIEMEKQTGQPYHSVLQMQLDHPEMKSSDVAQALNRELKPRRPFTDVGVRKILQRARMRFAELLLQEVQVSIGTSDLEAAENELADLGLLVYAKPVIDRFRRTPGGPPESALSE